MSKTHDHLPPFEPVYRCRGCGGITQTEGVSCDCEVPALQDWEKGTAVFSIHDPAAALTAAREALEAEELWRNQRGDTGTLRAIAKEKRLKAINLLTPAP